MTRYFNHKGTDDTYYMFSADEVGDKIMLKMYQEGRVESFTHEFPLRKHWENKLLPCIEITKEKFKQLLLTHLLLNGAVTHEVLQK